jgi:hypothetical protein
LFRAAFEARGGVVEPVADGFAQAARRARDGVAYAAARGAGDAADRAGETAYGVLFPTRTAGVSKDGSLPLQFCRRYCHFWVGFCSKRVGLGGRGEKGY